MTMPNTAYDPTQSDEYQLYSQPGGPPIASTGGRPGGEPAPGGTESTPEPAPPPVTNPENLTPEQRTFNPPPDARPVEWQWKPHDRQPGESLEAYSKVVDKSKPTVYEDSSGVRWYTQNSTMWDLGFKNSNEYIKAQEHGYMEGSTAEREADPLYHAPYVTIYSPDGPKHITRAEAEKLSDLSDEDQFDELKRMGIYPKDWEYEPGKGITTAKAIQQQKELAEQIKNAPAVLRTAFQQGGVEAYNRLAVQINAKRNAANALTEAQLAEFKRNNVELPDHTWMPKGELARIKDTNQRQYKLLTENGYQAYADSVDNAIMTLRPYRNIDGTYNVTDALFSHQKDVLLALDTVFSGKQMSEIRNENKAQLTFGVVTEKPNVHDTNGQPLPEMPLATERVTRAREYTITPDNLKTMTDTLTTKYHIPPAIAGAVAVGTGPALAEPTPIGETVIAALLAVGIGIYGVSTVKERFTKSSPMPQSLKGNMETPGFPATKQPETLPGFEKAPKVEPLPGFAAIKPEQNLMIFPKEQQEMPIHIDWDRPDWARVKLQVGSRQVEIPRDPSTMTPDQRAIIGQRLAGDTIMKAADVAQKGQEVANQVQRHVTTVPMTRAQQEMLMQQVYLFLNAGRIARQAANAEQTRSSLAAAHLEASRLAVLEQQATRERQQARAEALRAEIAGINAQIRMMNISSRTQQARIAAETIANEIEPGNTALVRQFQRMFIDLDRSQAGRAYSQSLSKLTDSINRYGAGTKTLTSGLSSQQASNIHQSSLVNAVNAITHTNTANLTNTLTKPMTQTQTQTRTATRAQELTKTATETATETEAERAAEVATEAELATETEIARTGELTRPAELTKTAEMTDTTTIKTPKWPKLGKGKNKREWTTEEIRSAVAFQMGKLKINGENKPVIVAVKAPFRPSDQRIFVGLVPPGMKVSANMASAKKTIQLTTGRKAASLTGQLGMFRYSAQGITRTPGAGSMSFSPMPGYRSKKQGRMYVTKTPGGHKMYSSRPIGRRR